MLTSFNDTHDILSDEVKSLLDGHIVLDKTLAESGHYPAIDITRSVSRLSNNLFNQEQTEIQRIIKKITSRIKQDKGLLLLGGKADPELQACLAIEEPLRKLLTTTGYSSGEVGLISRKAKEIVEMNLLK